MNFAQIRKYDIANGPFVRATLFVSGCTHNCPECFNKEYQNFDYGNVFDKQEENSFIDICKDDNVKGITILGGEPLQQDDTLANLIKRIKRETNKTIWVYTGYTFEHILNMIEDKTASNTVRTVMEYCDVLVDGPFIATKKDITLRFRGSTNQRIIDIKKSMTERSALLYAF